MLDCSNVSEGDKVQYVSCSHSHPLLPSSPSTSSDPKLPPAGPSWGEVNALLALKSSNFDPANALASWVLPRNGNNNTAVVCRWYGVGCNRQGHVRNLTLAAVLLTGGGGGREKRRAVRWNTCHGTRKRKWPNSVEFYTSEKHSHKAHSHECTALVFLGVTAWW